MQNARVTAFMVSKLLRENQQGREGGRNYLPPPPPTRLGLSTLHKCKKEEYKKKFSRSRKKIKNISKHCVQNFKDFFKDFSSAKIIQEQFKDIKEFR